MTYGVPIRPFYRFPAAQFVKENPLEFPVSEILSVSLHINTYLRINILYMRGKTNIYSSTRIIKGLLWHM